MQRILKTTSFLAAWLFAFSLVSNCYCLPAFASAPEAHPVMAHCQHHSDGQQAKKADCAPRYQTDQFENISVAKKAADVAVAAHRPQLEAVFIQGEFPTRFLNWADPPPVSSPQFFVLHHAFLI